MEHKIGQYQGQFQKLVLSPQLRQYLNLLQLPAFELEQRIDAELIENPALEEVVEKIEEDLNPPEDAQDTSQDDLEKIESALETLDQLSNDTDPPLSTSVEAQRKRDYQEAILTRPDTLADYLASQLSLSDLSEEEEKIAGQIIGNINGDGYLCVAVGEIMMSTDASEDDVERVLTIIQSLDPSGVGGRTLQEVLLIQLRKLQLEQSLSYKVVQDHFDVFTKKHIDNLASTLKVSVAQINSVYEQVAALEPKPGRSFTLDTPDFVIPEARVIVDSSGELQIEMFNDYIPSLKISQRYRQLARAKDTDKETKAFLKEKITAGLDLIRALSQRKSTIELVTEQITVVQKSFFIKGSGDLKPLRLKDIAEKINMHESTVSRAIQGKFLSSPHGTVSYKSFFPSKLASTNGANESQASAVSRLKQIIQNENKKKPLSDEKLVDLMAKDGIKLARRTVAKYRTILKILPAHLRKER